MLLENNSQDILPFRSHTLIHLILQAHVWRPEKDCLVIRSAPLAACACLNQMKNKRMTDGIMCWVIYRQAAGAKHTFLPPLHYNAITAVIIIFGLLIVCGFYSQFK